MPLTEITITDANSLASDLFIKIFGNVVEHCPAAAIGILKERPFRSTDEISLAINGYLDGLTVGEKHKILEVHPDLAGKLAQMGKLTDESSEEQKSAGLDVISDEDRIKLTALNKEYKNKFKFPFVICARENRIPTIIAAVETRLGNIYAAELQKGIEEVKKIAKLRIEQIILAE